MKTSRAPLWFAAAGALLVTGLVARSPASGIPTQTPMFYSGTLEDNGAPVDGTRAFTLILWNDPTATGAANKKCETTSPTTAVAKGHFRIALDATCVAAVAANPDLFVEVIVGATSLGRKKLGAVPYAVEAKSAVAAQTATTADTATTATGASGTLLTQIVPAGAVMYFNLAACPTGWTELTAARGRYIVGVPNGGTLVGTKGTALGDLEDRPTGAHTHTITDPGHTHSITDPGHAHGIFNQGGTAFPFNVSPTNFGSDGNANAGTASSTTGITIQNKATGITGTNSTGPAGTNAPYIQLRVCQKG